MVDVTFRFDITRRGRTLQCLTRLSVIELPKSGLLLLLIPHRRACYAILDLCNHDFVLHTRQNVQHYFSPINGSAASCPLFIAFPTLRSNFHSDFFTSHCCHEFESRHRLRVNRVVRFLPRQKLNERYTNPQAVAQNWLVHRTMNIYILVQSIRRPTVRAIKQKVTDCRLR